MTKQPKKIVLFSYNPVPTKEYKTIEGSALRFWRMALELKKNGYNDITIAIWEKFPQKIRQSSGIKLVNFSEEISQISRITKGVDVVIFSCAMGFLSAQIAKSIEEKTLRIVDAYSPMYVEFLTKSHDKIEDRKQLEHMSTYIEVFNNALQEADVILIANDNQKHLYRGVLAGIGQLISHDDSRFVMLPAFVEEVKRKQEIPVQDGKMKMLWFGGVYPWFDIEDIINVFKDKQISDVAVLDIVGGSNPFYPKDNMRFNGKYMKAHEAAKKHGLLGTTINFYDWVEYDQRLAIFDTHDIGISVNSIGVENEYSFRLRVADMVGNGLPVATNGGDPLCEELLAKNLAYHIDITTKKDLRKTLLDIVSNKQLVIESRRRLLNEEYQELHLSGHIHKLIDVIETRKPTPRDFPTKHNESKEHTKPITEISTKELLKVTHKRLIKVLKVKLKLEK